MDLNIKRRWVEALRSGNYKQGTMYLRDQESGYCCLGVLCDVIRPDGWGFHDEKEDVSQPHVFSDGGDEQLSPASRDFFGIPEEIHRELIDMNDAQGKNFSEIADYIEEYL